MPFAAAHPLATRGFLGTPPTASLRPFHGPRDTLEDMRRHILGDNGERSMLVRSFTEWVIRGVAPKDYLGEILAIRNALVQYSPWNPSVPLFRYVNDPRHVEMIKTPERQVREIMEHGTTLVDCDDSSTMAATMLLQIGRNVRLAAMGFEPQTLSHVAVHAQEPKSGRWLLLDSVAGPRETEVTGRVRELMIMELD